MEWPRGTSCRVGGERGPGPPRFAAALTLQPSAATIAGNLAGGAVAHPFGALELGRNADNPRRLPRTAACGVRPSELHRGTSTGQSSATQR